MLWYKNKKKIKILTDKKLKNLFSKSKFGELKNSLINDILTIYVIDSSLKERTFRGPN